MAAHQAPPSLGFSRQEHWSGLPFPSPMQESEKVKVKSLSRVWLLVTPWTAAHQAPPSMGFSRQEYWSRVPCQNLNTYGKSEKMVSTGRFESSKIPPPPLKIEPKDSKTNHSWHHFKQSCLDFPGSAVDKNLPASRGNMGSIPGPGRSHMLQSNYAGSMSCNYWSPHAWSTCS